MESFRINWKVLSIIVACIILQMTVVTWFSIGDIAPNLCFLFLAFYAFEMNRHQIFLMAFVTGLCRDFLTQSFFGIDTVSMVFGSIVLHEMASRFDRQDSWVQFWGTFLFSFASLSFYLLLRMSVHQVALPDAFLFLKAFLITIYTTLLVFVGFPLFRRLLNIHTTVKQYELF